MTIDIYNNLSTKSSSGDIDVSARVFSDVL